VFLGYRYPPVINCSDRLYRNSNVYFKLADAESSVFGLSLLPVDRFYWKWFISLLFLMEAGKFGGAARTAQLRADLDKPCAVLHHLPCTIQHTGPARVSDYFLIEESTEDNDPSVLKSSIRGRLLKGSKICLPPSAQGSISQRLIFRRIFTMRSTLSSILIMIK